MATTLRHLQNNNVVQPEDGDKRTGRPIAAESTVTAPSTLNSRRSKRAESESRSNEQAGRERLDRALSQKRGPNTVMVGVLSVALAFGLLGFALHFLWIVAIIVMAIGLGYTIANGRRDRIDVVNQLADDRAAGASQGRTQPAEPEQIRKP
jgi:hypothetical protein